MYVYRVGSCTTVQLRSRLSNQHYTIVEAITPSSTNLE